MRTITAITATGIAALLAFTAQAQTDPTRESTPATPLSTTLGLVVFPAKNQSKDQQATDETECYAWSKQQTGIDPFAARRRRLPRPRLPPNRSRAASESAAQPRARPPAR
jgi:hypothetical protein